MRLLSPASGVPMVCGAARALGARQPCRQLLEWVSESDYTAKFCPSV